ncbi:AMP-binding protein [Streptomyces polychromogenes]|uniref:AMP-binding protein n=1 Tax=Streptomyces polychromogenes TaxID=67342 RepID=A0ABN0UZU8_9ACTN
MTTAPATTGTPATTATTASPVAPATPADLTAATAAADGAAVLLHDLLDRAAALRPDLPAVSGGADRLTHAALAHHSRRLAGRLHGLGVRPGDRVVIVAPSDTLIPVLCHAVSRLGAAFSVLHEQTTGRPLEHVLADCTPALLVAEDPGALATAEARGIRVLPAAEARDTAAHDGPPAAYPERRADPSDVACLVYTSGSTALPKAVVSTHAQMLFAARAIQTELAYRPDDIVYCPVPLSFDYGLYQLFLGSLSGAHVHLGRPAEAGPGLAGHLTRTGATVLAAVPSVAENLARLLGRSTTPRPLDLRLLTSTGAAMNAGTLVALRAALPALRVQLMYGLTECKRVSIMPPDGDLSRPGASGRALPGTEVHVEDATGRRLPPGESGEFVVSGPHVMSGYWGQEELTEARFTREAGGPPRLRTGDFGHLDAEGYLYFSGRGDDLYKERGFRVSGIEVETAACRVPGVEAAALLPPRDGTDAVLVVVGPLTAAEVLAALRGEIEEFKIPRTCLVRGPLPLTANGKIDRAAVRAWAREQPVTAAHGASR